MKVITQLIRYIWRRGVLSVEQADHLVCQGFARAEDLKTLKPRPSELVGGPREETFDLIADELIRNTTVGRSLRRIGRRAIRRAVFRGKSLAFRA